MTLDFTLDEQQLALRDGARQFADGVLSGVASVLAPIPGPEERFYAIKPFVQQMVDAGFLKALIPNENGGEKLSSLQVTLAAEPTAPSKPRTSGHGRERRPGRRAVTALLSETW